MQGAKSKGQGAYVTFEKKVLDESKDSESGLLGENSLQQANQQPCLFFLWIESLQQAFFVHNCLKICGLKFLVNHEVPKSKTPIVVMFHLLTFTHYRHPFQTENKIMMFTFFLLTVQWDSIHGEKCLDCNSKIQVNDFREISC